MPKNTYLPKDNFPKIEEVREIENYVPTYEEFLKTYEAEQKVTESYENELSSYEDVGGSKGFGPCYVCHKTEQWTDLKIRCGGENCSETTSKYWHHNWCGGKFEVSNRAYIRCSNCQTSSHINGWSFGGCSSCSYHSRNYYRPVSWNNYNSFRRALGLTLMAEGCSEVLVDLAVYMVNHKSEWNS
jgi:hypothetical protein